MFWWCLPTFSSVALLCEYQPTCVGVHSGAMTTPVYTSVVCRLTFRRSDDPLSLAGPDVPMQTQRWDVCRAQSVFARLSAESPPGSPIPRDLVCWGKKRGQGGALMCTGDQRVTANVWCTARGQKEQAVILFPQLVCSYWGFVWSRWSSGCHRSGSLWVHFIDTDLTHTVHEGIYFEPVYLPVHRVSTHH